MPGAGAMSDREVRQTAAYVRSLGKVALSPVPGDAARGAEIYRGKGNCSSCHSIRGKGGVGRSRTCRPSGNRAAPPTFTSR